MYFYNKQAWAFKSGIWLYSRLWICLQETNILHSPLQILINIGEWELNARIITRNSNVFLPLGKLIQEFLRVKYTDTCTPKLSSTVEIEYRWSPDQFRKPRRIHVLISTTLYLSQAELQLFILFPFSFDMHVSVLYWNSVLLCIILPTSGYFFQSLPYFSSGIGKVMLEVTLETTD